MVACQWNGSSPAGPAEHWAGGSFIMSFNSFMIRFWAMVYHNTNTASTYFSKPTALNTQVILTGLSVASELLGYIRPAALLRSAGQVGPSPAQLILNNGESFLEKVLEIKVNRDNRNRSIFPLSGRHLIIRKRPESAVTKSAALLFLAASRCWSTLTRLCAPVSGPRICLATFWPKELNTFIEIGQFAAVE